MSVKLFIIYEDWQFLLKANIHPPGTSNSTPRFLPRRNKNICSEKDLYEKIHSSLSHNSQNLETTQIFVSRWVDHHIVYIICTKEFCTAMKRMNYWFTQPDEHVSKNDSEPKKPDCTSPMSLVI